MRTKRYSTYRPARRDQDGIVAPSLQADDAPKQPKIVQTGLCSQSRMSDAANLRRRQGTDLPGRYDVRSPGHLLGIEKPLFRLSD